ncbi:amidohydrolase family protein [Streptomyces sp. NPDC051985]|uniref:amidohydrolase family protein n=1 Tax=Streptomyces sp. NPDC051985 TaxID=3155807 RepID=UPI003412C27E
MCLPDTPASPWPDWAVQYGPAGTGGYPVSVDQLLDGMDQGGIDRAAIQVPTWFCGRDEYALESAAKAPDRFAVMARPRLDDPGEAARLARLFENETVRGIRAVFIDGGFGELSAERWLTDGTCDWLYRFAAERDIPLMLWAPRTTEAIGPLADRYPGLRIILDQMNGFSMQPEDPADYARAIDPVLELAARPTIAVKLRVWDWQVDEPHRGETFEPEMKRLVDAFGAERTFWCSDFMNHRNFTPARLRDVFANLPFLGEQERNLLMGEALCNWLDWP